LLEGEEEEEVISKACKMAPVLLILFFSGRALERGSCFAEIQDNTF
jgi:hypothetical protein